MDSDPITDGNENSWQVVFRNPSQSLVLYNPRSNEVRTLQQSKSPTNPFLNSPWSQENYFEILAKLLAGNRSLPPSLNDFLMNGYFEKFFPIRHKIGSGGMGSVYRVEHRLAGISLATYAVKIVPVGDFSWLRHAVCEVQLLEKLGSTPHPLVLGYKHCWIEDFQPASFGPKVPCLFILMEYAPCGSLESFLMKNKHLTEQMKWQIFSSIAVALGHIHSLGILHCDLKLSNVLVFDEPTSRPLPYRFAISDFGTAIELSSEESNIRTRTGATGTIETMAPELLLLSSNGEYSYRHSFASDIWSLGTIIFTLFFGIQPFGGEHGEDLLRNFSTVEELISNLNLNSQSIPEDALRLIKMTMQKNPSDRCFINTILNDSFVFHQIKLFGLQSLVYKDSVDESPHIMVLSPSLEDLNASRTLLALPFENEHKDDSNEKWNQDFSVIRKINLKKNRELQCYSFLLLFALLAVECSPIGKEIIHLLFVLLLCTLIQFKQGISYSLPVFVALETLFGWCHPTLFLLFLIVVLSLLVGSI